MKANPHLHNAIILAATAAAALLLSPPAVPAAEVKVGFVNMGKVLDAVPQTEAARGRIEKEFAPRDRKLLQLQRNLASEEDRLVKDGAILSESDRTGLEADIRRLRRDFRRSYDEFREDRTRRNNEELQKLQRKVIEVVQTMAKAENFDLIVAEGGVVFAGERVEITGRIIELLKSEFEVSN